MCTCMCSEIWSDQLHYHKDHGHEGVLPHSRPEKQVQRPNVHDHTMLAADLYLMSCHADPTHASCFETHVSLLRMLV